MNDDAHAASNTTSKRSAAPREILARVVDDFIGAQPADEVGVGCAADSDDVRAEVLRDLHGEVPDPARGAGDQDALARAKARLVDDRLQCRSRRDRQCGGLIEAEVVRHRRQPIHAARR